MLTYDLLFFFLLSLAVRRCWGHDWWGERSTLGIPLKQHHQRPRMRRKLFRARWHRVDSDRYLLGTTFLPSPHFLGVGLPDREAAGEVGEVSVHKLQLKP